MRQGSFDKIVAVKYNGEWIGVTDCNTARNFLLHSWPVTTGPSHRRALAASEASDSEIGWEMAARAAFTVAAMEAGFPFEVFDDWLAFIDFQVAHATVEGVRSSDNAGW